MSGVWFTSDLHVGHRKVAELRGYADVAQHDAAIARGWEQRVGRDDQVWVLGDLASSNPARALALLADLPGEKHLVWGNHDAGHPQYRDAHRRAARYAAVFASTAQSARRRIAGVEVLLSHYPYTGDHTAADRDVQWRLPDLGGWLLHGHTHQDDPTHPGRVRQVNVGVDAWAMAPVSLAQIEELVTPSAR